MAIIEINSDPFCDLNTLSHEIAKRVAGANWHDGSIQSAGHIRFTGWKSSLTQYDQAVAQWLDWREVAHGGRRAFYVNLPGFEYDYYERGDNFNIGTERISPDISQDHLTELIEIGFRILMEKSKCR